jgi:hypothetical protein
VCAAAVRAAWIVVLQASDTSRGVGSSPASTRIDQYWYITMSLSRLIRPSVSSFA